MQLNNKNDKRFNSLLQRYSNTPTNNTKQSSELPSPSTSNQNDQDEMIVCEQSQQPNKDELLEDKDHGDQNDEGNHDNEKVVVDDELLPDFVDPSINLVSRSDVAVYQLIQILDGYGCSDKAFESIMSWAHTHHINGFNFHTCLLYTSPSPRDS